MDLRVLLIDDDREFCTRFAALSARTFALDLAHGYEDGLKLVQRGHLDAVLLDIDLGEARTGLDLLHEIVKYDPDLPIIMLTGDDRPDTIDRALCSGAWGYTPKQPNLSALKIQIEHNIENARWRLHARSLQDIPSELVGSCPAIEALRIEIQQVAATSVRVLLRGEGGSGKDVVARAIHGASQRRYGRFVAVNGAVGPDETFDSMVFGHERGAYTGADKRRIGTLELANGGTLFLDEVGKMNLNRQAKLLRVIEDGSFERLGGSDPVRVDTRFICASNENLEQAVAANNFRSDFYYRIRMYEIVVPPLRERFADLPELMQLLADRFCDNQALPRVAIAPEAVTACRDYDWPGNVRELDAVLQMAILSVRAELTGPAVRRMIMRLHPEGGAPTDSVRNLREARDGFERQFIQEAVARCGGSVEKAADEMGVGRSTLYQRMERLGLAARQMGSDGD